MELGHAFQWNSDTFALLGAGRKGKGDLSAQGLAKFVQGIEAGVQAIHERSGTMLKGWDIVALICIAISFLFAIITNHWWVLLGIVAAVWLGSRTPWGSHQ